MLWHKHQLDCTTLIRPWIDDWRGVGGDEGLATDGLITEDSSSWSARAGSNRLLNPDPTNKDIELCCSSSFNLSGSGLLTAKCFFVFYYSAVLLSQPVVLAQLQRYMMSPNRVQSQVGILSLSSLGWKRRHTVKVHAGGDGCYFLLNGFAANDVLRGVTGAALTAKGKIVKSDSLRNLSGVQSQCRVFVQIKNEYLK